MRLRPPDAPGLAAPGSGHTVIDHWDGSTWRLVPSLVQGGDLDAVTAISAGNA